jgi:hypothetical protein
MVRKDLGVTEADQFDVYVRRNLSSSRWSRVSCSIADRSLFAGRAAPAGRPCPPCRIFHDIDIPGLPAGPE